MALTASDIARFLPGMVDPTAGARAASQAFGNIRDREAQLQIAAGDVAQRQASAELTRKSAEERLAFDKAKETYGQSKDLFERNKAQQLAYKEFMDAVRGDTPADIEKARAGLKAFGLDMDVREEDGEAPAPEALTLGDMSAPPAPPEPTKVRRVVVTRDGEEIGSINLDDLILPNKAALETYVKSTQATKQPITQEEVEAYKQIYGTEEKAVDALRQERQLRKEPAPNMVLQGEAGSDLAINQKLWQTGREYIDRAGREGKLKNYRETMADAARLRQLIETGDPLTDAAAFASVLKSLYGRASDQDLRELKAAGGLEQALYNKGSYVANQGKFSPKYRASLERMAAVAERAASSALKREVDLAEKGVENLVYGVYPAADPATVEAIKGTARNILGGSGVEQRSNQTKPTEPGQPINEDDYE